MENHNEGLECQTISLFQLYDRLGLGQISRQTLLANLAMIDGRISEKWLVKILAQQGISLPQTISCCHFIKIMEAITALADEQED